MDRPVYWPAYGAHEDDPSHYWAYGPYAEPAPAHGPNSLLPSLPSPSGSMTTHHGASRPYGNTTSTDIWEDSELCASYPVARSPLPVPHNGCTYAGEIVPPLCSTGNLGQIEVYQPISSGYLHPTRTSHENRIHEAQILERGRRNAERGMPDRTAKRTRLADWEDAGRMLSPPVLPEPWKGKGKGKAKAEVDNSKLDMPPLSPELVHGKSKAEADSIKLGWLPELARTDRKDTYKPFSSPAEVREVKRSSTTVEQLAKQMSCLSFQQTAAPKLKSNAQKVRDAAVEMEAKHLEEKKLREKELEQKKLEAKKLEARKLEETKLEEKKLQEKELQEKELEAKKQEERRLQGKMLKEKMLQDMKSMDEVLKGFKGLKLEGEALKVVLKLEAEQRLRKRMLAVEVPKEVEPSEEPIVKMAETVREQDNEAITETSETLAKKQEQITETIRKKVVEIYGQVDETITKAGAEAVCSCSGDTKSMTRDMAAGKQMSRKEPWEILSLRSSAAKAQDQDKEAIAKRKVIVEKVQKHGDETITEKKLSPKSETEQALKERSTATKVQEQGDETVTRDGAEVVVLLEDEDEDEDEGWEKVGGDEEEWEQVEG